MLVREAITLWLLLLYFVKKTHVRLRSPYPLRNWVFFWACLETDLSLEHRSNCGQMPFLIPPTTLIGFEPTTHWPLTMRRKRYPLSHHSCSLPLCFMSIYIYFSAGTYGSKGIHQFQSAVAELGICIAADEVIESGADDQALDVTVNKLITNKAARVIVCFCDGNDVQLLIKALKRRGQEDYFTIIGRWVRFGSLGNWMLVVIFLHFLFYVTLFVGFLPSGVGLPSHCFLNCIRFIYYSAF